MTPFWQEGRQPPYDGCVFTDTAGGQTATLRRMRHSATRKQKHPSHGLYMRDETPETSTSRIASSVTRRRDTASRAPGQNRHHRASRLLYWSATPWRSEMEPIDVNLNGKMAKSFLFRERQPK